MTTKNRWSMVGFIICVLVSIILMSLICPANAESKMKTHVLTKSVKMEYDSTGEEEITYVYKYKYDKNWLLKKIKTSTDTWQYFYYTFSYKDGLLKKGKSNSYFAAYKLDSDSAKFSYNKRGRLIKVKIYNRKGKLRQTRKIKRNKRGDYLELKVYNKKGKMISKEIYLFNKRGESKEGKLYKKGSLIKHWIAEDIIKNGKRERTITTRSSKGALLQTEKCFYDKNGNAQLYKRYDKNDNLREVCKYKYKKIKTKKVRAVKEQQYILFELYYI